MVNVIFKTEVIAKCVQNRPNNKVSSNNKSILGKAMLPFKL